MTGMIVWVVMVVGGGSDKPLTYEEAYNTAHKTKKPMLILLGAEWCPACRAMKETTLPQLLKSGKLSGVSYTFVDADRMPRISQQLMRPGLIPQIIFFAPVSNGWNQTYLQGIQSPEQVLELVRTGIDEQRKDLATAKKPAPNPENDTSADE